MRTAHANHLQSIRTATKEKPYTIDYDFLDFVQQAQPDIYKLIQKDMQNKICIAIPAGYHLAEA